ncbi:MAG TPA: hypothetical protein VN456_10510 [Desulfosporosinus sp.]|nr:hypothetical protein [Desulfosporosinus sp.]
MKITNGGVIKITPNPGYAPDCVNGYNHGVLGAELVTVEECSEKRFSYNQDVKNKGKTN